MAENTKIEWCHHTFNPWIGCTKVSPACDNCYAEAWSKRYGRAEWGNHPRQRTAAGTWRQPLKWNREAAERGVRYRVFCASLADVFDNQVPAEWRNDLWELIASTRNLDWLLLTKRPQNIAKMLPVMKSTEPGYRPWNERWPWRNVWLGTTVENQTEADRRIPILLDTPAALHWISGEPLLGPMDLTQIEAPARGSLADGSFTYPKRINALTGEAGHYPGKSIFHPNSHRLPRLGWVVGGFESGRNALPGNFDDARSLRDQCAEHGTPFLWKQNGEFSDFDHIGMAWNDLPNAIRERQQFVNGKAMIRVGKKAAGRLLDGVLHDGFPQVHHG